MVVVALTTALDGSNRRKKLVISNNDSITKAGWMGLSTALSHPNSALEVIGLLGIHFTKNNVCFRSGVDQQPQTTTRTTGTGTRP